MNLYPASIPGLATGTACFLALAAPAAMSQTDYHASLMCNGQNVVQVTSIQIWCEQSCAIQGPCPGLVATYASGPGCAGLLSPDGGATLLAVPPHCNLPGCKQIAHVFYSCNGSPQGFGCCLVPAPGSGTSHSVDLNCGPMPTPGATFILTEGTGPMVYCTGKVNSLGCTPAVGLSGEAILSSPNPFLINAKDLLSGMNGLLFYGFAPASVPFQGGTLCLGTGVTRTAVQNSGGSVPPGSDCSGAYSFDFNAYLDSGADPALVAGVDVHVQFWGRDPAQPPGQQSQLTNAASFPILP